MAGSSVLLLASAPWIRCPLLDIATQGYAVVAPALFDRVKHGAELGYTPDDIGVGRDLRMKLNDAQ
jgi:dienelactone hydrolase